MAVEIGAIGLIHIAYIGQDISRFYVHHHGRCIVDAVGSQMLVVAEKQIGDTGLHFHIKGRLQGLILCCLKRNLM